jgi:endonuclease/exonuclease/phosphatase family metal-dependent hydrolase
MKKYKHSPIHNDQCLKKNIIYPLRRGEQELIVATLNVHSFHDKQNQSNIERIANILKPLSIDILNLQEVKKRELVYNNDNKMTTFQAFSWLNSLEL